MRLSALPILWHGHDNVAIAGSSSGYLDNRAVFD
jgi:hypothetical protein